AGDGSAGSPAALAVDEVRRGRQRRGQDESERQDRDRRFAEMHAGSLQKTSRLKVVTGSNSRSGSLISTTIPRAAVWIWSWMATSSRRLKKTTVSFRHSSRTTVFRGAGRPRR